MDDAERWRLDELIAFAERHGEELAITLVVGGGVTIDGIGGIATGSGKGGSAGGAANRDTVTMIRLTSDGAGGFKAPELRGGDTFNLFGADSPALQRQLSDAVAKGRRRGLAY